MTNLTFRFQYQLIAQQVKEMILRGDIGVGERLESERALGQRFQVQRNTVRQALEQLEREGHIATKGRRGSYVLPPKAAQSGKALLMSLPSGAAPNVSALAEGFSLAAASHGFGVRRSSNDPRPDSNLNVVPNVASLGPDVAGLLIWPHFPIDADEVKRLIERIPVVLVDQRIMGVAADSVRSDDVAGGRLVTEHLLELGHTKIGFLTDEVFAESVQDRWKGYALAHEESGVFCDPRLSLLYQFLEPDIFEPTLRRLWENPEGRPTAIICSNDVVAFILLRFLHGEGIRVPEDIAVTGYGNSMPDYTEAISLTTVDQPFHEVGREAARLLCERIRQPLSERVNFPQDIVLPVQLVARGSTADGADLARRRKQIRGA